MVTGGSGYIASWIVKKLLERGYRVHATVRNKNAEAKIAHLLEMQAEYGDNLQLFEADLTVSGSFEAAVKGCEAVIHCASPFATKVKDVDKELLSPAKEGTLNVLRSALNSGSVRRVVLTSSATAIYTNNNECQVTNTGSLNESNWNSTASVDYQPYSYSKTIAEQAAWEFAEQQEQFELVTINPTFVLGPALSQRMDGISAETVAGFFAGQFATGIPDLYYGIVDVRDVSEAHILALENETAQGRFLLVSEVHSLYQLGSYLKGTYGKRLPVRLSKLPKFMFYLIGPMFGFNWEFTRNNYGVEVKLDASKSREILGITYIEPHETIRAQATQLLTDGLVKLKG